MNGIINVYKERGFTSHDVVAKLRGILHMKKIGHTGTLDPDATGVLPVCIGKATKVCGLLTDKDKTYRAVVKLGVITNTEDMTGEILAKHPVSDIYKLLDEYRIEKAAAGESDAPEDENAASLAALVGELKKLLVCLYPEEQSDRRATDARLMKLFAFIEKLCADAALSKKLTFARARFAQVYSENECMLEKQWEKE